MLKRGFLQERQWLGFSLALVALLLGGFLRWFSLTKVDFPLNDGGLFFRMTQEIIQNNLRLPEFSTYNHANIPFAYPPLGFYLAAFLSVIFKIKLIDIFRFLPAIINLFSLVIFYFISKRLLAKEYLAGIATIIYAIIPSAFWWVIMGGGITRSPGLLFQFLTILIYLRFAEQRRNKDAVLTGLFLSLTLLSHLEIFWETCLALFVFFIFNKPSKQFFFHSILIGLGAVIIASPYWGYVISKHGLGVYQNAFFSGGFSLLDSVAKTLIFNFTDEFKTTIITVLGIFGLFYCLGKRQFVFPVWLLLIIFLNQRSMDRSASKVIAMLAAIAMDAILIPALASVTSGITKSGFSVKKSGWLWIGILILQVFLLSFIKSAADINNLVSVSKSDRDAMDWSVNNTPVDSKFLIIDNSISWETDKTAEWFPALSNRISSATIQGKEWFSSKEYQNWDKIYDQFKACASRNTSCLEEWAGKNSIKYDYIFISDDNCVPQDSYCVSSLAADLRENHNYEIVYDHGQIEIYKVRN